MIRVTTIFNKPCDVPLQKKPLITKATNSWIMHTLTTYYRLHDVYAIDGPVCNSKYVLFEWYWTFCNDTRDPAINTHASSVISLPRDYRKLI